LRTNNERCAPSNQSLSGGLGGAHISSDFCCQYAALPLRCPNNCTTAFCCISFHDYHQGVHAQTHVSRIERLDPSRRTSKQRQRTSGYARGTNKDYYSKDGSPAERVFQQRNQRSASPLNPSPLCRGYPDSIDANSRRPSHSQRLTLRRNRLQAYDSLNTTAKLIGTQIATYDEHEGKFGFGKDAPKMSKDKSHAQEVQSYQ
jgi:hypothetical protein